ncbi:MAG: hypothetical protein AB1497_00705 [Bacillota bacterium]
MSCKKGGLRTGLPNTALKGSTKNGSYVKTGPAFRRLKRTLSKLPGLERAYLFGPGEDLNLLIIGEVDHPSLLEMVREVEHTLDRGINFLKCSTSEFTRRLDSGDPFMSNIITSSPPFIDRRDSKGTALKR